MSCDSRYVLNAWKQAMGFRARLVSDFWPHGDIGRLYGAFDDELGLNTRSTFIIDADGVIRDVISTPSLRDARDVGQYVESLRRLMHA